MMGASDRAIVDEIKRRLADAWNLAGLLGLKPRRDGRSVKVPCVWHAERSGSLDLATREGVLVAHCHGCGRSGDALALVAAARGLDMRRDFPRVLVEAAALAGIALDESTPQTLTPRPMPPPGPGRTPPPPGEVAELWRACSSVYDDADAAGYLTGRGIDPALVVDRDLARVLPSGRTLPRWARYRGNAPAARPWPDTGHRLIVPMFDAAGGLATVRAWRIVDGDGPKRLPPAGYAIPRSVMADPLARILLSTGAAPGWWTPRRVLVAEGEPDFVAAATMYGDSEHAPAVLGIVAGAWSAEIAARIPDGAEVVLATDSDDAGERYAAAIGASLAGRCALRRLASERAA